MSLSPSTLEILPDEMILEICQYFHSGDVLYSFYGLNSRLNRTILFYCQHVSLHRTFYMQFIHIFTTILPQIEFFVHSLVIYELESALFLTFFKNNHIYPNLKKLTLINWTDEKLISFLDTLHGMKYFHKLVIHALDLTETIEHIEILNKVLSTNDNRLTYVSFDHECDPMKLVNEEQYYTNFTNIIELDIELQTTDDLFQLSRIVPNVKQLHATFKCPWMRSSCEKQQFFHLREFSLYAMSYFSTFNDLKSLIQILPVVENFSFVCASHDLSMIDGQHIISIIPSNIKQFHYSICFTPRDKGGTFNPRRIIESWNSIPITYSINEYHKRIFLHTVSYQSNRLSLRSLFNKQMPIELNSQIYRNVRHLHVYDTTALTDISGIVRHCRQIIDLVVSFRTLPSNERYEEPRKTSFTLPYLRRLDYLCIQGNPTDSCYIEKILLAAPNLSAISIDFDCLYDLLSNDDQSLLLFYLFYRRIVILCLRFEDTTIEKLTDEHIHCIARVFSQVNHLGIDFRDSKLYIDSYLISFILKCFPKLIVLTIYGRLVEDSQSNKDSLCQYLLKQSTGRLTNRDQFQIDYGNKRIKNMSDSKVACDVLLSQKPQPKIKDISMMKAWKDSNAYREYTLFIQSLNRAVHGLKNSDPVPISPIVEKLINLLDQLDSFIDQYPLKGRTRFGDAAFRDWYTRFEQESKRLLKEALPDQYHHSIDEINPYLLDSFGNKTRLDYGTGHELAYALFLLCLCKLEVLTEQDSQAIVLKLFARYLDLCRKLQRTYYLEPAGSKGQWCLDDYHFLPFLWGSSQLTDNSPIEPKQAIDERFYRGLAKDYLYLGAIKYINEVKTGPFFEHSSTLYDVSNVAHWSKINQGMIKMYHGEVLDKFPIAQHILFGNLISFDPVPKSSDEGLFKKPASIQQ